MTAITYRGVTYDRETHQANYLKWWAYVHRATLWLVYRGIKYRPASNENIGPSIF